ncbi:MAG TPA: UDP-N-acetylmuramoyl-tripeptide--D-alanyl-D-alanine ligase [Geopsychrobacteraceae bacterium]|nr:UDP-N-acetylmuramoyl-tripeptide--D-alanyl-D-alanine ligase [Geopsychrobacteraceae bacterium]
MMFSLEMVARITAGDLPSGTPDRHLSGISTDSRNLKAGELFVPLRGARFDGHDYLIQAVRNGAAACLSEEVVAGLPVPVIRVTDTLRALGDLAAASRLNLRGPVVAITGSAGKTTTKEMLASILEQQGPGLKTAGNFNNLIGLPLTLLQLKPEHRWAVIEMGTSALGEIERLTEIAAPDIGIITNVGPAHLETLQGLAGVARAKGELFAGLHEGVAVINLEDERVARLPVANGVKKVGYGLQGHAEVRATDIHAGAGSVSFTLLTGTGRYPVKLQAPGQHNVLNALAAATAAQVLKIPAEKIISGLEAFRPIPGRMNLSPMPGGGLLLDDSYNANPMSAAAALKILWLQEGEGRKIAVLGDMLELGDDAKKMHRDIGALAARNSDQIVAVGGFAADICAGAAEAGMSIAQMVETASCDEAIEHILKFQRPGDCILVKGSRGVQLDKLSAALLRPENTLQSNGQGG